MIELTEEEFIAECNKIDKLAYLGKIPNRKVRKLWNSIFEDKPLPLPEIEVIVFRCPYVDTLTKFLKSTSPTGKAISEAHNKKEYDQNSGKLEITLGLLYSQGKPPYTIFISQNEFKTLEMVLYHELKHVLEFEIKNECEREGYKLMYNGVETKEILLHKNYQLVDTNTKEGREMMLKDKEVYNRTHKKII